MKCAYLMRRSTTTQIVESPLILGKEVRKYILISYQAFLGIRSGGSNP